MFSKSSNGSKIALIVLMGILVLNNFQLLDVQFMTDHLKTMGAKEISRNEFLSLLQKSTDQQAKFAYPGPNIIDKNLIYKAEKRY